MADVNANIRIGIDSSSALAQLKTLQSQISQFNNSVVRSNAAAVAAQQGYIRALDAQVSSSGRFITSVRTMESSVDRLGSAFDKGTLSTSQYFRTAMGSTRTFGRFFRREMDDVTQLAERRVKALQTQYVALGRDAQGAQRIMAMQPTQLATGYATNVAMAHQKQILFNRALQLGTTNLVNWGKNTQWAGRQLMVGFTVPLTIAAGAAAKFFMDIDKAGVAFRRVYGDFETSAQEAEKNLEAIKNLATEYTKYGLAVSEVIDLGARAAATGATNEELLAATEQTLRLATLGQMDYNEALDTTISLQTAFQLNSQELAEATDFLNAVENQTVLTIEDLARAIPRVAPVIKGLGGDVKDLAVFMTALREGGVTAEQGANALKSGLASLINPTNRAQEALNKVGININAIVEANKGDLMATVTAFGEALSTLSEFEQQRALEQVFGKFQYARIGALFKNIARDGSQAATTLQLAGMATEDLASLAESELSKVSESVTNQFLGAVERLKAAVAPIGEMFLKAVTPIINAVVAIADKFNSLPDAVKQAIGLVVAAIGLIAPALLMGIGLIANGIGNGLKAILVFRNGIKGLIGFLTGSRKSFEYNSIAAIESATAMSQLDSRTSSLTPKILMQAGAVDTLTRAYGNFAAAAAAARAAMPQGFVAPPGAVGGRGPIRRAAGGFVPGSGNGDTVPALLTPGEFVVNRNATEQFAPILSAINSGNIPGFAVGGPVGFDVGGRQIELSVGRQSTIVAIQRRIDAAISMGAGAVEEFATVLSRFADRTGVTVSQIDQEIRKIPKIAKIAAPESYSAPTFIQTQSARMDWTTRQQEISAIQESVAQDWPEIADDTKKMRNLTNTQASHIEQINTAGKSVSKDWTNLANLTPDLGGINNYLNRVKGMNVSGEVIEQIMAETGLDMRAVNTEVDKLKAGIHPTTRQAASVLKSLANLDANLSRAAISAGKTATALGTTAATGYQATAVSAALSTRLSGDFYETLASRAYQPAGAAGAAVAGAMSQGGRGAIGAASPAKEGIRLATDYVDGIELGARQNAGQARSAGASIGSAFNQGALSPSQTRGAVLLGQGGVTQAGASMPLPSAAIQNPQVLGGNYINPALANQLNDLDVEVQDTTKQARNLKEKIGNVSGKVAGFGAAVTGVTIAASFMDNKMGEMAQQAMPVIFGLQGVAMALPMLMNPIGIAVAALVAVGGGLWYLNNVINNVRESGQQLADNMSLSATALGQVSEFFGNTLLIQRQGEQALAESAGIKSEELQQIEEFIQTDIGKEMVEGFSNAAGKFGSTAAARDFAANLASMMLQGAINYDQARILAASIERQFGEQGLSAKILGSLQSLVGPNGEDLLTSPLEIGVKLAERRDQRAQLEFDSLTKSIERARTALTAEDAPFATDTLIPIVENMESFRKNATQSVRDFSDSAGEFAESTGGIMGYLAGAVSGVTGAIAGMSETATGVLEGQNFATDIAKSVGSIISPEFEAMLGQFASFGKMLGNDLRVAYDDLQAAQSRYNEELTKAQKIKNAEKRQNRLEELQQEKKSIDALSSSIENQREQAINLLNSLNDVQRSEVLVSTGEAITEMFAGTGMETMAASALSIIQGLEDQDISTNLIIDLSTGQLSPAALNRFLLLTEDTARNAAFIDLVINDRGVVEANNFFNELNAISNEKFIIDIVTRYTSEGEGEFSPEQQQAAGARGQVPEAAMGLISPASIDQIIETQALLEQLQAESKINLEIEIETNETEEVVKNIQQALDFFANNIPDDIVKELQIKSFGKEGIDQLGSSLRTFMQFPDNIVKEAMALYAEEGYEAVRSQYNSFSGLPDAIAKYANAFFNEFYTTALIEAKSTPGAGFGFNELAYADVINAQMVAAAMATSSTSYSSTPLMGGGSTGGGGTTGAGTGGTGGGGGGGGGTSEKTGAELLKEYIDSLNIQKKLIGKIVKEGGEIKSGFAQALRNAGAPEQLIADIISKGEDGIKMAKKLLKDRAKELKELTQLMFSVNRLAFIESQRSAAENARAQRQAQQGLLESGFSFDVAQNVASDENTAAAVADSYARVQAAEREVASTEKGTAARKKANEELRKARKEWDALTAALQKNIDEQEKLQIADLIGEAEQEADFAARKISAGLALIGKGFDEGIVGRMIGDPAVVNQVSGYVEKLRDLERQRRKILRIDKEDRTEKQKEKLIDLNKEIARTTRQYNRLIKSLEELSDAEREALVSQVQEGFTAEATALQREEEAINLLMGQGLTYDQASAIAGDADRRDAILASIGDQETLNALLAQAVELTEAQQAAAFRGRIADLGKEVDLQKKKAELIKISGGDQLTLNYLTSMSYEDILYFLSLSAEEQQNFLNLIEDSFTAADKIAEAFNQINERQEYSNSLLEAQANERFGVMDEYNEQERSLERQIRSTERLIDTAQDQIDAIEEENDDLQHTIDLRQREIDLLQRRADEYNRGLELIQRQEDEINESYDERLEALDELDRVNQRIISRQRDQVSLSQALSEGDIYAATQATKQIRQNETAYAIEESRAALEESRQNELKNISVEINGVLLNREQIEERLQDIEDEIYNRTQDLIPLQDEIYQNGLDIYNIQEKTLEPLENQLELLNDQKQVISDLRKDWQDYYEYLQENAVDPLTGMKFKDLQKLRELYEAGLGTGLTEEQALQNAINRAGDFGIDLSSISSDALRRAFGVTLTIPTNTEEVGGGGPTDLEPDKYEETFGHDYDVMTDPSKPPPGTPGNDPNLEWVWNPSVGRWGWQRKPQPGSGTGPTPEPESTTPTPETPTQTRPSYADARAETAAKTGLSGRALTLATREYLQGFANMFTGGAIFGKGRRDSVPVMASPGEFIVRNSMVEKYGLPMLNKINQGSFRTPSEKQTKIKNMSAEISGPVYNNYSVSVTANTNANADEIANKTITKIKQLQASSIRSSRV